MTSTPASKDPGCICYGNWRAIVKECDADLGRTFIDRHSGKEYTFFGVVHSDDDYYYGMWRPGDMRLLSCVGSIRGWGFKKGRRKSKRRRGDYDGL